MNKPNRENNVSLVGNIWKLVGKLENIVSATKMFLNLLGNIFASWDISATMFPEVGKQGNIDRKHNVSATMFPSLPGLYLNSLTENILPFSYPCVWYISNGLHSGCMIYKSSSQTACSSWNHMYTIVVLWPFS